ncbi:MAG: 3-oxoadipate enol-lactonase / 4-carboxymuconolactone decarboxylase, partial [Mycobacterium sp.]|nr:3-oxoadipate enol-lactonase / 4-carboxymuconolactone decarboxylase [Mycobacterium sp.]
MTVPELAVVDFGGPADGPLILLGPSLGTSAATLWGGVADRLVADARLVAWDLPGHGRSAPADPFGIADLAAAVLALADRLGAETFHYAGDSVGGAVGLQLVLDAPHRVGSATLMCTGAVIGTPDGWRQRAATVRADGISPMVDAAPGRWFAPGFVERHPGVAAA